MSIRIRTLRELSRGRKRIARVRWRCWAKDATTGEISADEDGNARDPLTWARWEEEYFLLVELARTAVAKDKHARLRPRGVIDQVMVRDLWRVLEESGEELDEYDEGKLRVLYARVGGLGRLACDAVGVAESVDRVVTV
jgi:hypothetical protein